MAIRTIIKYGDDILTKRGRTVEKIDDRVVELLNDMKETLKAADGIGLAAPQVGVLRRIAVVNTGDGWIELINPEVMSTTGTQREPEGCLSFPGKYGEVVRPQKVKVKAQDRKGKWFKVDGEGLLARALCHEIDHLNGEMFIDKVLKWTDNEEKEKKK